MNEEFVKIIFAITILLTGLTAFIIISYIQYRKKQHLHLIEKEKLLLQFKQEILTAQVEIKEQTMESIGSELHDNIGQILSLISLTLRSIDLNNLSNIQSKVDTSIELTSRSIKDMRSISKLLQGNYLIDLGLLKAIRLEVDLLERIGQYSINYLETERFPIEKNSDKDLIIFRIFQEILNNIIKHSSATQIDIILEYIENNCQIQITDNGLGFDYENISIENRGIGLQNIQKRAGIVGGKVTLNTKPGEGTFLIICIPYP